MYSQNSLVTASLLGKDYSSMYSQNNLATASLLGKDYYSMYSQNNLDTHLHCRQEFKRKKAWIRFFFNLTKTGNKYI